jgi:hypothetical protein
MECPMLHKYDQLQESDVLYALLLATCLTLAKHMTLTFSGKHTYHIKKRLISPQLAAP